MNLETMTRSEMEMEVLSNGSLYATFDEKRLLDGQYSDDEMRGAIREWIIAGDECS